MTLSDSIVIIDSLLQLLAVTSSDKTFDLMFPFELDSFSSSALLLSEMGSSYQFLNVVQYPLLGSQECIKYWINDFIWIEFFVLFCSIILYDRFIFFRIQCCLLSLLMPFIAAVKKLLMQGIWCGIIALQIIVHLFWTSSSIFYK